MTQLSFFKQLDTSFPTNKQTADPRKLRGGYYTLVELAHYLVKWGLRQDTERILEPSCGDGNFLLAILDHMGNLPTSSPQIVAVELVGAELEKARQRVNHFGRNGTQFEWLDQDFFEAYIRLQEEEPFDLIVGNPPFIRFQHFEDDSRNLAFAHLRQAGYKPTKLANAWAAFVQLSIELLKENGRLPMVLPAELLQVKYAHELRQRLAAQFKHILIVGFKKLVFPEIQQEVVLLLAEGKQATNTHPSDIHTLEISDSNQLAQLEDLDAAVLHIPAKHSRQGMKWTALFLEEDAFAALDEAEQATSLIPLGQLAEVDVGIVTGRNSFFILTEAQRDDYCAEAFTVPVIGRTTALKTIMFTPDDFSQYTTKYPAFLLDLNGIPYHTLPQEIQDYIAFGEGENIHGGYKCRIRPRWYDVPSIHAPDAFLFRQIHRYPLMVVNEAQATSTDTIHRVRVKEGTDTRRLAALFFNSLTLAWAEVCGRSYGGGVLELEPREAEQMPIPYAANLDIDVEKVAYLLHAGCPYEALAYVDHIALKDHLGFDDFMVKKIRRAWEQLRDRRIERK